MSNVRKMIEGIVTHVRQRRSTGRQPGTWDKERLIYPFRMLLHPLQALNDVKYEDKGSLFLANVLMVLFFLTNLLQTAASGYLYNPLEGESFSLLSLLAQTVGVALLWTVCNWATCTLTDGEGKMREIWIMLCYALLPYILLGNVSLLLSHVFSLDESILYGAVQAVATLWTGVLLFLAMLTAHQYTVGKTILSCLFTLLAILAACFLLLLFFSIAQQIVGFVTGIAQELSYR